MRSSLTLLLVLAVASFVPHSIAARSAARAGGGASVSRPAASRPSVSRPSSKPASRPSSRPAGRPSVSKPSTSRPSVSKPSSRPAPRPSPGKPAVTRPAGGGSSLSKPSVKPGNRPVSRPSTLPGNIQRPTTKPSLPDKPATRPGLTRPGGGPVSLPGTANRPSTLPGNFAKPGGKPERPTTLPGNLVKPGGKPERPTTLPGNLTRPGTGNRPPTRPGVGDRPVTLPGWNNRPGWEGNRPDWGDRWNNSNNDNWGDFNKWHGDNNITINNFNDNRVRNWNNINTHYNERGWWGHYGREDYHRWCGDVYYHRGGRCREVWLGCYGYHEYFFNVGWWGNCWWRPAAVAAVTSAVLSPWWWWQPVTYPAYTTFYGPAWPPQPVVYDPGTNIIIEGDVIYQNGQSMGSATEYRQQTIALASPAVEEYPVPEPVVEGQPAAWLPLGVWALTQQEEGDAVMFFQLSSDKNGLVAGAYKNVMTGEDQPVIGQIDQKTQRIAWHIGENTSTVYETGLSSLTYDAASVFVHFGEAQSQTWLLVRLPSPEMPPGTVKLPEVTNVAPAEKK